MTPKEKAKELVDKFKEYAEDRISEDGLGFDKKYCAKQCAILAVDEIIEATIDDWSHSDYWQQVKTEIQAP
jgi:hypothetical protein